MGRNGILDQIEDILIEYHRSDDGFYIKLSDVLSMLEFHCSELSEDNDVLERLARFFDSQKKRTKNFSLTFLSESIIHFIDIYFQNQIEYHGMYVLAAMDVIKNPDDFPPTENGYFNSAKPEEIISIEYFKNISNCKNVWEHLSRDFKKELLLHFFPYPEKQKQ